MKFFLCDISCSTFKSLVDYLLSIHFLHLIELEMWTKQKLTL